MAIKKLVPFQPFAAGTSYIPTLANKHGVVNVKNYWDDHCFKWAILSAMFPADSHVYCLTNYLPYEGMLNC